MWRAFILGLLSLAEPALALRTSPAPEQQSAEILENATDADNTTANTSFNILNHVGPKDSDWALWEQFHRPDDWKLPRRGEVKAPTLPGETGPSAAEYFGKRRRHLGFLTSCGGLQVPEEPLPGETWVVTDVRRPTLQPRIVPEGTLGRRDISVIVVPGGGGEEFAWDVEGNEIATWLNSLGISAFILKHRIPVAAYSQTTIFMDLQRAVTLAKFVAPTLGLSASRVGTIGFSMGGLVVLNEAIQKERLYEPVDEADGKATFRPDFVLGIYPAVTADLVEDPKGKSTVDIKLLPPTFLMASEDDPCIRFNWVTAMFQHMPTSAVEMHMYPTGPNVTAGSHGYGICVRRPIKFMRNFEGCSWPDRAVEFILRRVGELGSASAASAAVYEAEKSLLLHRGRP